MDGKNWLANCAVLRDEAGEFLGTVTVLRDITEIKEVEKIKSRFISLVAHELRAPVAAIKGYLDIILKRAAGDDQKVYDNMLERSRSRADGLLDLIQDLLGDEQD
jgi:two-component system, OmpR family, phosphate regulon sensor histidine kinase PhoR